MKLTIKKKAIKSLSMNKDLTTCIYSSNSGCGLGVASNDGSQRLPDFLKCV